MGKQNSWRLAAATVACAAGLLLGGCADEGVGTAGTSADATVSQAESAQESDASGSDAQVAADTADDAGAADDVSDVDESIDLATATDPTVTVPEVDEAALTLTQTQRNSLNMLNYLAVLLQEINDSSNSRLRMEQVYAELVNNTNPGAVDDRTLVEIEYLLDVIESYRMTDVKRERLELIYETAQAQAVRATVPDPVALFSTVSSASPARLLTAVAYMALDAVSSYDSSMSSTEATYLQDGWALDDEAASTLHSSRKGLFSYMVRVVGDYDIPGTSTLSEQAVEEFVSWSAASNVTSRIRFLESNKDTYGDLGAYWLELAESYYEDGQYGMCLAAVDEYEARATGILRNDYDYAATLPFAVAAADAALDDDGYVERASGYAADILANCGHDDWALRYFAAQTYVDLYQRTGDKAYLDLVYATALDSVNYLVGTQREMNAAYLAPVAEASVPKGATATEKTEIGAYNKLLKEERAVELPPVYEPLLLNCDILLSLQSEDLLSDEQQLEVGHILQGEGPLFLTAALNAQCAFGTSCDDAPEDGAGVALEVGELQVPAALLSAEGSVTLTVAGDDGDVVIDDWTVKSVARGSDDDLESFVVTLTSATAKGYAYQAGTEAVVSIEACAGQGLDPVEVAFSVVDNKPRAVDALLRLGQDDVVFERA